MSDTQDERQDEAQQRETQQADTQQHEPVPDSEARLKAADALRSNSIGWIANADAKATTIASVLTVVLGVVSIDMAEASRAAGLEFVYAVFLCSSAVSVGFCVSTLWPVTKRKTYVKPSSLGASPTFFGDIPKSFEDYAKRSVSEEDLRRDRTEQAFIIARIARRKMRLVRCTIASFVVTMVSLIVLAGLGSFAPGHADQALPSTGQTAAEGGQDD